MFKLRILKGTDALKEIKRLNLKLLCFLLGIMSSLGSVFGSCNPFGVAVSVVAENEYSFPLIAGSMIGYIFLPKLSRGICYMSIILTVLTFKWLLCGFEKIRKHILFLPLLCFGLSFLIKIFVNYSTNSDLWYIWKALTEAFMIAVSTYFFEISFKYFTKSKYPEYDGYKINHVFISILIIISSLSSATIYNLSVGRILSVIVIIFAAYCRGIYGGSAVGTAVGAAAGMSSVGMLHISGIYALGGMFAGFCTNGSKNGNKSGNKIRAGGAFLVFSTVCLLNSALNLNILVQLVYETVIGVIIFSIIPKNITDYIKLLFGLIEKDEYSEKIKENALKNNIETINKTSKGTNGKKLYISETIKSLSNAAENVMNSAFSETKPKIENACMNSVLRVCGNCNLKNLCWECKKETTKKDFEKAILDIIGGVKDENLEYPTGQSCKNFNEIIENIKRTIDSYEDGMEAKIRAKEIYNGMSEKFLFAEAIVGYTNEGIKINDNLNLEKTTKIKNLLSDYEIETVRTECIVNSLNKMFIEIEVMKIDNKNLINKDILGKISLICERQMSEPIVFDIENRTLIRISEKAVFNPQICVNRHNCNNRELCGDYCSYFRDGTGKFFVIISDGMGSGGRAAADGAVTAGIIERLIRLRVDPVSAIKIANLSISGKASEESLTAVDIMVFDLYSGETEFVKAGAPLTIIRKGNRIHKIEDASLPIGIFDETNLSVNKLKFSEGDTIVMLSDGITDIGTDWIENKLKSLDVINANDLADYILRETAIRRKMNHDDDATTAIINI